MKETSKNTLAAFVACASLLAAAGCAQNTPAASTTSAAATSAPETTKAPETTTAAPETTATTTTTTTEETAEPEPEVTEAPADEPVFDSDQKKHPFRLGVWIAKDEYMENGEIDTYDESYYCFREGGGGTVLSQTMGIGLPFSYEQDPDAALKCRFEMGAVDSFSDMEITSINGDNEVTVKWTDNGIIETWEYLAPIDDFSFYSNASLEEMAKYYYGIYIDGTIPIEATAGIRPDATIDIKLYNPEVSADGSDWLTWFYIDRYTGKGHDMNGEPIDLTAPAGSWPDMPYPNNFTAMPAIPELNTLRENGEMLGFWYIGYVYPQMNDYYDNWDVYREIYSKTGMDAKVPYLRSFPSDCFVATEDGQELYLLLPADIHGCITVTKLEYDETTGEQKEGEELYRKDDDLRPVLLKCNQSEIMPDVLVRVTDSKGQLLEWSPSISGENGKVVTGQATHSLHDFTDYDHLMHPDNMPAVG